MELVFFLEHKDDRCVFKDKQHAKLSSGEYYYAERPSWKFRCESIIPVYQHAAVDKLLKKFNKKCVCVTNYKCILCAHLCPANRQCLFFNENDQLDLKYFEKFLSQTVLF
jgi:hypothetical protein